LDLLFVSAWSHGLDKLRLHTETTQRCNRQVTDLYGRLQRQFRDITCAAYNTRELPKEVEARQRRALRKQKVSSAAVEEATDPEPAAKRARVEPKKKKVKKEFNLNTYKFHSMGDYPSTIAQMGTTDNWTTQIVGAEAMSKVLDFHDYFSSPSRSIQGQSASTT
jgi:hypothetical protein